MGSPLFSSRLVKIDGEECGMKPKISIIVPVYNVEKYLSRCLDSLLTQSLTDIEVIAINDGSTDSSLKILNNYRKRIID